MYIETLKLTDFRNYKSECADFFSGLNILSGTNASGKTNLLEAAYAVGVGKSPRTNQDKEMVRWEAEEASVRLRLIKRRRAHDIEIRIDKKGKKRVIIDGRPQVRIAELLGYLNVVFFSPDELKLVKEGPAERRRFMDVSLCQQSPAYLRNLSLYNKTLTQRNRLLRMSYRRDALFGMLDVFDIQLAKYGVAVTAARRRFVENLQKTASDRHLKISGGKESLTLEYEAADFSTDNAGFGAGTEMPPKIDAQNKTLGADGKSGAIGGRIIGADTGARATEERSPVIVRPRVSTGTDMGADRAAAFFVERYRAERERDIETALTNSGPHRDDLKISLNGTDARKFGSQGQQRSAALSLKLAEIDSFKTETGETPVLLLDDVLSELDEDRQRNLLETADGVQTILTCTHFDLKTTADRREFVISDGRIIGRAE
jgi:DNA replication and repair protein RecF